MPTKILVVDDDPTLAQFLEEYLLNTGYLPIVAHNGPEALRLFYHHHPDLVVLDVMMPGMDGWEVTVRLRELSDTPIILLTAKSAEADKLRGFRLGVDDYVIKPFSFAELQARIQAVLGRARQQTAGEHNTLALGDLVMDMDKREVRRNDIVLQLTPTEFRLLEVLARQAGKALSEAELMQEVWGINTPEETATVRRYIWLLRRKLEEDPANPRRILTVRGYGYRLER